MEARRIFIPLFSHTPLISVLLVWQVVPWLFSGFESVGKYSEEASADFGGRGFFIAIALTLTTGMVFFWIVISSVAYVAPWQSLNSNQQFPTAVAFERALHAHWIVGLIMGSALVALVQAFNANMIASSRVLFAMARRNLIAPRLDYIHPVTQSPSLAIAVVSVGTVLLMFLGEAGLVPILEVGAVLIRLGVDGRLRGLLLHEAALGRPIGCLVWDSDDRIDGVGQNNAVRAGTLYRLRVVGLGPLGRAGYFDLIAAKIAHQNFTSGRASSSVVSRFCLYCTRVDGLSADARTGNGRYPLRVRM